MSSLIFFVYSCKIQNYKVHFKVFLILGIYPAVLGILDLLTIEFTRRLFNNISHHAQFVTWVALLSVIFIFTQVIKSLQAYHNQKINVDSLDRIRQMILDKNHNIISWRTGNFNSMERFTVINNNLEEVINETLKIGGSIISFLVRAPLFIIYALYLNSWIACSVILSGVLLSFFSRKTTREFDLLNQKINIAYNKFYSWIWSIVDNFEIISVSVKKRTISKELKSRVVTWNELHMDRLIPFLNIDRMGKLSTELVNLITVIGGVIFLISDLSRIGDVLAIISSMEVVRSTIYGFPQLMKNIEGWKGSKQRIEDFLDQPEEKFVGSFDNEIEQSQMIATKAITLSYGSEKILEGIDLKFLPGKFYVIVGPSGCGKTSLLQIISRLITPSSGEVLIDKNDYKGYGRPSLYQLLSYCSQTPTFMPGTILQNIDINYEKTNNYERIIQIMNGSCFIDVVAKLKEGLNTFINASGDPLSSGERQLLAITRELYANKKFIFFDEALSAIDNQNTGKIFTYLKSLTREGKCIVLISHDISNLGICDEIIFMSDGKIINQGPHEVLLKTSQIYKKWIYAEMENDTCKDVFQDSQYCSK